jgi:hypothetical protein
MKLVTRLVVGRGILEIEGKTRRAIDLQLRPLMPASL